MVNQSVFFEPILCNFHKGGIAVAAPLLVNAQPANGATEGSRAMDRFEESVALSRTRFGKAPHDIPFVDVELVGQTAVAVRGLDPAGGSDFSSLPLRDPFLFEVLDLGQLGGFSRDGDDLTGLPIDICGPVVVRELEGIQPATAPWVSLVLSYPTGTARSAACIKP